MVDEQTRKATERGVERSKGVRTILHSSAGNEGVGIKKERACSSTTDQIRVKSKAGEGARGENESRREGKKEDRS